MYIVHSYALAVAFCVLTMLCWGSWANSRKLTDAAWRFELFYWDYVLGVLLLTLVMGLTLGSSGAQGRPFVADLAQASGASVLSAMLGGAIFNLANILLVAAIEVAGMAVAFPVGIGLALLIGVIVNYLAAPVGNAPLLFLGVGLVTIAIVLDAIAYGRLSAGRAGVTLRGLLLSLASGVFMDYAAVFVFAVGVAVSSLLWNTLAMRRPVVGTPVSFGDYFRGSLGNHLTGIFGGVVWGLGMSFNLIASGRAGFAISYGLGQGATMIAALWGVFIWREFRSAPAGTSKLLAAMFACFLSGIALIVLARS